jgi:hypothetical protein
MALVTRFDTPGRLRDFPDGSPFYDRWHEAVAQMFAFAVGEAVDTQVGGSLATIRSRGISSHRAWLGGAHLQAPARKRSRGKPIQALRPNRLYQGWQTAAAAVVATS